MTHGKGAVFEVKRHGPDHTEVQLTAGQAQFTVDPLPPGGVFAVQTPYARVEVVGTAFSVDVVGGCSQVKVSEGRVRVRQGERVHFLNAGESHRACPKATAGEAWVQAGMADLAAGRTDQAVAQMERYLDAYPRGALAEDALYNLVLAARQSGAPAGLEAACQRYLKRFPTGARAAQVSAWAQ
jgi:ferric-dicitrate binding protein FerR (iron transport regulator)